MNTSPGKQLLNLLVIPIVLGVLAAVAATLFLKVVELGQELLFAHLPHALGLESTPWWLASIYLVAAGALIVVFRNLPGKAGASPLTGFHFDTPAQFAPAILLTALVSLAAGASLGPEAPLIILGTTIAALLTRKRDEQTRKAAMFIAGAAAIGAVFGNPFVTAFMILEFSALGVVPFALVVPVMTALAASYVVQIGIWNIPGLAAHPLAVPGLPEYPAINFGDFLSAAVVAVGAGLVALLARILGNTVQSFSDKKFIPTLAISIVIIGAVLFITSGLLNINLTQVLFSGNSGMPELIATTSVGIVVVTLVAKTVVYSLTLGSGFRGGPIFPVTFLGVIVGVLASLIIPGASVSALAAAGIAGASAAFLKLPATSALLAALLIGGAGAGIAPIAIIAAVLGFAVRLSFDAFTQKKIETAPS